MGYKNNDPCYSKAEDDEPMFTLLGRDFLAPMVVRLWADIAQAMGTDFWKVAEARDLATAMEEYRKANGITKMPGD